MTVGVDIPRPAWRDKPGETPEQYADRRRRFWEALDRWWEDSEEGRRLVAEWEASRRRDAAEAAKPDGHFVTVYRWETAGRAGRCAHCGQERPAGSVVFRSKAGERCAACLDVSYIPGRGGSDWVEGWEHLPPRQELKGLTDTLRARAGGRSDPRRRCSRCAQGRIALDAPSETTVCAWCAARERERAARDAATTGPGRWFGRAS